MSRLHSKMDEKRSDRVGLGASAWISRGLRVETLGDEESAWAACLDRDKAVCLASNWVFVRSTPCE